MSHVATGCLIAGFLVVSTLTGSFSLPDIAGTLVSERTRGLLFVLFFAGFGIKAGVIPLHVWLPEAHPAAPSNVSAVMSAVMI